VAIISRKNYRVVGRANVGPFCELTRCQRQECSSDRHFRPLSPRRDRDAANTRNTIVQSGRDLVLGRLRSGRQKVLDRLAFGLGELISGAERAFPRARSAASPIS
jgi:hypothetical protein